MSSASLCSRSQSASRCTSNCPCLPLAVIAPSAWVNDASPSSGLSFTDRPRYTRAFHNGSVVFRPHIERISRPRGTGNPYEQGIDASRSALGAAPSSAEAPSLGSNLNNYPSADRVIAQPRAQSIWAFAPGAIVKLSEHVRTPRFNAQAAGRLNLTCMRSPQTRLSTVSTPCVGGVRGRGVNRLVRRHLPHRPPAFALGSFRACAWNSPGRDSGSATAHLSIVLHDESRTEGIWIARNNLW